MSTLIDAFRLFGFRWLARPQAAAKIRYLCTHSPDVFAARFFPGYDTKEISREMIGALTDNGFYFEEFYLFDLAKKKAEERRTFISERSRFSYYRRLNPRRYLSFFQNKRKVWQTFSGEYRREILTVTPKTPVSAIREFLEKHNEVVIKPCKGSCGSGVSRHTTKAEDASLLAAQLVQKARKGECLCEEALRQDGFLHRVNPCSLNTMRAVTVLTRNPRNNAQREKQNAEIAVQLFHPFQRFGRAGSCVDNLGVGGIVVEIDPATGALGKIGRDETGRLYREHPDSHVKFDGHILPEWDKAMALLHRLALRFPDCRCIGWDLAYTADRGWVMIEANIRGQMIGQQMVSLHGVASELEALIDLW